MILGDEVKGDGEDGASDVNYDRLQGKPLPAFDCRVSCYKTSCSLGMRPIPVGGVFSKRRPLQGLSPTPGSSLFLTLHL